MHLNHLLFMKIKWQVGFTRRLKCDKITKLSLTLALIMKTGHPAFETHRNESDPPLERAF